MARKALALLLAAAVALSALGSVQSLGQDLGPGPYTEAEKELQNCIDLTRSAGFECSIESDIMAMVFPRDSRELPTGNQTLDAILQLRAAALPSQSCCDGLTPYILADCPCLPSYQRVLPAGGLAPAYIEGSTQILAMACRINFQPCSSRLPPAAEGLVLSATVPPVVASAEGSGN